MTTGDNRSTYPGAKLPANKHLDQEHMLLPKAGTSREQVCLEDGHSQPKKEKKGSLKPSERCVTPKSAAQAGRKVP